MPRGLFAGDPLWKPDRWGTSVPGKSKPLLGVDAFEDEIVGHSREGIHDKDFIAIVDEHEVRGDAVGFSNRPAQSALTVYVPSAAMF